MSLAGYGTKLNAWALRSKLSAGAFRRERLVYNWTYTADPFSDYYGINWQISTGTVAATESFGLDWLYATGHQTVEVRFGSGDHPSGGVRFGSQTYAAIVYSGSTGSLAATESGSDALAATGAVAVTGSAAFGDSPDVLAASGSVLVSGSLASSESGSDVLAATGAVKVSGALAVTEAASDTATASGTVLVSGSLGSTESGSDTLAASGLVYSGGILLATESGSDTLAAAGAVTVSGTIAATESGADAASISGTVPIAGTLSLVESIDTFAASGGVAVLGDLLTQETGSDTLAATGAPSYAGDMIALEDGSDTFAAVSGYPDLFGSMNVIEAADRFRARASSISTADGAYMLRELIYIGRNNVAQIRIGQNSTAIDFGGVTRMVLILQGSGIRIDSAIDNEAIDWDNAGNVRLKIGAYPIAPSRYWASIIAYDPEHDDGQLVVDADDGQLQLWCVSS